MAAQSNKPGQTTRAAMPAFGVFPNNKMSLLLEKTNPGLRRSTPDSEALASSDDEVDQNRSAQQKASANIQKPTRRTSWLNEVSSAPRKPSVTNATPYSPSTPHPTTPSGDQTAWGTAGSPGLGGSTTWNTQSGPSYSWGNIWNNDAQKDPPARMREILPSPTAINPPIAKFLSEDSQRAAGSKSGAGDSAMPFSFPLHPTPKTYRSQSYSVGQLDPETLGNSSTASTGMPFSGRGRGAGPYPGLQRRSSRPSGESGGLGLVHEVEDGEEEDDGVSGVASSEQQALQIQQLKRENTLLRQQAANNQFESRLRERTMSSNSAAGSGCLRTSPFDTARSRGGLHDHSDLAVEDFIDGSSSSATRDTFTRKFSKQSTPDMDRQGFSPIENPNLENAKRAQWQTSLGFGSVAEPPQSRRHSFADIPTRHSSISSSGETYTGTIAYDAEPARIHQPDNYGTYRLGPPEKPPVEYSQYFAGTETSRRALEDDHPAVPRSYNASGAHGRDFGLSSQHSQPLFIVGFKCRRSDVFYIQEGTGLHVEPGDLVIVEADRGTDLGTVLHANISWEEARQKKEDYAQEHYKWLMMFSKQGQSGGPNAVNPNGLSGLNGAPGSAVGGMGPPGHHIHHEPQAGDLKPKLIKRLAQHHEIQTLKDKEGNEAKAKRMCQQKVIEHRLNMEILDAEFQMDWKKLTFYYFADTYINFNSLVTDLFKIYKTRIWMSAINPASFVTPAASLGLPQAFGTPVMGGHQEGPAGRRRQFGHGPPQASTTSYDDNANNSPGYASSQGTGLRNPYFNSYQNPGGGFRQQGAAMTSYPPLFQQPTEPFSSYLPNPYHMLNPNASSFASAPNLSPTAGRENHSPNSDWTGGFQGLSLGS